MIHLRHSLGAALLAAGLFALNGGVLAQQTTVDTGQAAVNVAAVADGLFPEDECDQLKAAGFKCMGIRPSVRYSLPAMAFKVGSADIPDALLPTLNVFAEVLRSRRGTGKVVRIEGHADASGTAAANTLLSQKRAEAVREYLVSKGADPAMLTQAGMGSAVPKNPRDPLAAENRRVEIGRADAAN